MTSPSAAALRRARRLHERGVTATALGRPTEAGRALARAQHELEGVPDHNADVTRLLARILMARASCDFERTGLPAALDTLARATRMAEELRDDQLVALCSSQRAMLYGRSGMMAEALPELDAAVGQLRLLAPRDRWVLLLNRGLLHCHQGAFAAAAADLASAEQEASAGGLVHERALALHNRGYVAFLTGELPLALDLMATAGRVEADLPPEVRLDHGRVLLEAGLIHEAVDTLTSAARECRDRRQLHVLGEIHLDLARAHGLLGDLDRALQLARAARDRFRRRGASLWAARSEVVALRLALARGTRLRAVARAAERLVAGHEAQADAVVGHQGHLLAAQARLELGEVDPASHHLARAAQQQDRAGAAGSLTSTLQLYQLRATAASGRGDDRAARQLLRQASEVLLRRQALTASLDLRTAIALHGTHLVDLDLALAMPRGPAAVLACTERWRAATMRLPAVHPPQSSALAAALAELRALQLRVRDDPSADQRQASAGQVAQLQQRVQALARTQAGGTAATRPAAPADVRDRLTAEGCDLLALVSHAGYVHGVGVVAGRMRLRRLAPQEEVAEVARRVLTDLQILAGRELGVLHAAVWSSLRAGLEALDRMIVAPFGLQAGRLVVVPHRACAALPWPMLPSLAGRGVVVAPSATTWLRGLDGPDLGRPIRVQAMAGPGLDLADEEVTAVHGHWPGTVMTPARTSSAAGLRHALSSADLVHVAAHGSHHQQSPMFASVRLADGPLFVHDLELQGVGAAHVVLSACEVGRSTVRPGDEPLGLAAGLLALGARSVLAAVCRVPDDVAAATMDGYHAALAAGQPGDQALTAAISGLPPVAGGFVVAGAPWRAPRPPQAAAV